MQIRKSNLPVELQTDRKKVKSEFLSIFATKKFIVKKSQFDAKYIFKIKLTVNIRVLFAFWFVYLKKYIFCSATFVLLLNTNLCPNFSTLNFNYRRENFVYHHCICTLQLIHLNVNNFSVPKRCWLWLQIVYS